MAALDAAVQEEQAANRSIQECLDAALAEEIKAAEDAPSESDDEASQLERDTAGCQTTHQKQ